MHSVDSDYALSIYFLQRLIFQKVMSPVCAFWVDDETGVGVRYQLDRVAEMFQQKYEARGSSAGLWVSR